MDKNIIIILTLFQFVSSNFVQFRSPSAPQMFNSDCSATKHLRQPRNNIQHNDIQHNDIQHNDIQHNDTQYNDTQFNDIQHNDTQHNDIQYNDTQHNNKK